LDPWEPKGLVYFGALTFVLTLLDEVVPLSFLNGCYESLVDDFLNSIWFWKVEVRCLGIRERHTFAVITLN
jgi:hypothetical protein